jgi:magnesium-dependent phosphatase 1
MTSIVSSDNTVLSILQNQNRIALEILEGLKTESSLFSDGVKPDLVVFDCDYTLWPFDCDKDIRGPYIIHENGFIMDYMYRNANPYKDVISIVEGLVDADIPIAYASRNPSNYQIEQLLKSIRINPKTKPHIRNMWDVLKSHSFFHAYSSHGGGPGKTKHFQAIQNATGISYKKMIFFDDLPENIQHARLLGITSVLVTQKNGLTWQDINNGFNAWRSYNEST